MSKTVNFRALAIVLLAGTIPSLMAQEGDYQKGVSYYKQGQYQKTIEEFEKIIAAHPDYESGHRILGDSYLKIKAYDKAIVAFQNALELKGDNYVTHYGLALSFFNEGRYREAMGQAGAKRVYLSGSGPSLFALVEGVAAGEAMRVELERLGIHGVVVQTVTAEEHH